MKSTVDNWINPVAVIKLFTNSISYKIKKGKDLSSIIKDRPFKRITEAWIASIQLLALAQKNASINFFIQENHNRSDAPDFYGLWLHKDSGLNKGYVKGIEVFRYTSESPLSLEEEFKKKISKNYSKDTDIVCHITKKGFRQTLGQISDKIKSLNPKNDIWIVGSDETKDVLVSKIYPEISKTTINIVNVLNISFSDKNPAFIKSLPVRKMEELRTGGVKFEKLGKKVLLTPEFDLIED